MKMPVMPPVRISVVCVATVAILLMVNVVLLGETIFAQTVEERPDREIPTAETVGEEAVIMAQDLCYQRGWDWSKVRSHSYKETLTIWHPSPHGGSDCFTFNIRTGALLSEFNMKKSDADGVKSYTGKYYYRDGTVVEASYRNEKPHGLKKIYYDDGSLKAEMRYKDGRKHGPEKRYDLEGNVVKEIMWENGVRKESVAEGE